MMSQMTAEIYLKYINSYFSKKLQFNEMSPYDNFCLSAKPQNN